MESYALHKEKLALFVCLKHFRQRGLLEPFHALTQRSPFSFEHPLLSRLHDELVTKADFSAAELLLEEAAQLNLFDEFIRTCPYKLLPCSPFSPFFIPFCSSCLFS